MDQEQHLPERKARKSVAFTDEKLVVDSDGQVTKMASPNDDNKDTALSHTPRTPPLSAALEAFTNAAQDSPADDAPLDGSTAAAAANNGEDGLDLTLKKKKKKPKKTEEDDAAADDAAGGDDDGGLDLTLKKKKKKKVAVKEGGEDDFAARLKAMDLEDKEGGGDDKEDDDDAGAAGGGGGGGAEDAGDMDKGTGSWAHDSSVAIPFDLLLGRFYKLLEQKNPDHATSGTRSYKIPPPQCMREGNKKTIFANLADICKRMKRTDEHVTSYLFAELGTSGSTDGSRRLVIKGRFQQKQLENVLRKYIIEYVTCKTCRSPDTELNKGENRLYFITCNSCGSRRSVTAVKTGFSAQVGKRRKMRQG